MVKGENILVKSVVIQKGKKSSKKLTVKRQFRKAMFQLNQTTPVKQRAAVWGASNKFIHDMSRFLNKISIGNL